MNDKTEVPEEEELRPDKWRDRLSAASRRGEATATLLEKRYLAALRYLLIAIATIALIGAASYFVIGVVKQIGASDVTPEPIEIVASEVAPLSLKEAEEGPDEVEAETEFAPPSEIAKKTLDLYKARLVRFERGDENPSDDQIIEAVWKEERWSRLSFLVGTSARHGDETIDLQSIADVAGHALDLTSEALEREGFQKSLAAYRDAEQVEVCRSVTRQRQRRVEGWDSYSTSCPGWFYSPVGCPTTRTVSEPYTTQQCEMQYPSDLDNPRQALASSIDRFADAAALNLEAAAYDAEERTAQNKARKADGRLNLYDSGRWFFGFMAIMLLYLLVAIERHQRTLRRLIPSPERDQAQEEEGSPST